MELEQKLAELSSKQAELERLEEELKKMQDKSYQVKNIEAKLTARYAEAQKKYPIDREQKPEIRRVIGNKKSAIKQALSHREEYVKRENSRLSNAQSGLSSRDRWLCAQKSGETRKDYNARLKHYNPQIVAAYKSYAAADKAYEASYKAANKECVDELKRLFGELDIDIKRFHKKGISKENLLALVAIMEQLCKEGENLGTIPASYHQKIYRWKQIAKDIPEDIEKRDHEKETAARRKAENKLAAAKKEVTLAKEKLAWLTKDLPNDEQKLSQLQDDLACAKAEYPTKRQTILRSAEDQINRIDGEIEEIRRTKESVQASIDNNKSEIDQYHTEVKRLEAGRQRVFVLSFGKKQKLQERISEIYTATARLRDDNKKLTTQTKDLFESLSLKEEEKDKVKRDAEAEMASLDGELEKLKKDVAALEHSIPAARAEIETLQESLPSYKEKVSELKKDLDDFHVNYLLKTYKKEGKNPAQIAETKKRITSLTSEIRKLKQEIAAAKKEEERRQKALRQEQIEKAKEAQRVKQEQEERQERIQRELLAREEEQTLIKAKEIPFARVKSFIQKIENDPGHALLQEESCPLTDDGKRVITNSIVRKRYVQKRETPECDKYLLMFMDRDGNAISEQRLIEQKAIGTVTDTSFELKADGGFHQGNYYLLFLNFDTGDILSASKYKINISFANDFDF